MIIGFRLSKIHNPLVALLNKGLLVYYTAFSLLLKFYPSFFTANREKTTQLE